MGIFFASCTTNFFNLLKIDLDLYLTKFRLKSLKSLKSKNKNVSTIQIIGA